MVTKNIAWQTGSGNITLTYTGQGDGTINVQSDANDLSVARSQQITIKTTNGSPIVIKTVTISQAAMPNLPYIDLGLPSGLLWAKGNIISDGNGGYIIGEETDYGAYFSWGNIAPHFTSNGTTFDDIDWGTSIGSGNPPYSSSAGASLTSDILSNDASHDAALALLGSHWHMPTKDNFQELYDNTDHVWATINGIKGYKFMKKTDSSVYVFFPAGGRGRSTTVGNRGTKGYYWASSWQSNNNAYYLDFENGTIAPQSTNYRYLGFNVRGVQVPRYNITITLNPTDGSSVSGVLVTVTDSEGDTHTSTTNAQGQVSLGSVASGSATVIAVGYNCTPQSITVSSSARSFTVNCDYAFVDLGLPSGKLWSKGNICRNSNGSYRIGSPQEFGCYISWANIVGHNDASGYNDGYNFSTNAYTTTTGNNQSTDISSSDAAHNFPLAVLGSPCHLPTKADYEELIAQTDTEWTLDFNGTGVAGRLFMKKTDHSVYIFFPKAGKYTDGYDDYDIRQWTANLNGSTAFAFYTTRTTAPTLNSYGRRLGYTVRAVI